MTEEELPLLTDVIGETLPILTEVVDKSPPNWELLPVTAEVPVAPLPAPARTLNSDEMCQLLQQLETHLETVFTAKLNSQLDQLQRLAVDLAVSEFKAELPKLLLDALNATHIDR